MKCNDFDAHIDEMLSGILHPDANQHMSRCERCTSHFRSRAFVQDGLRKLASASPSGPSRAADRAVMDAYRRLHQQRHRAAQEPAATSSHATSQHAGTARLFTFPSRGFAPAWASRTWLTGAAAAVVVFAIFGSAVHLWTGVPAVNSPTAAITNSANTVPAPQQDASAKAPSAKAPGNFALAANSASRRLSQLSSRAASAQSELASAAAIRSESPALAAKSSVAYGESGGYDSVPVTPLSSNVAPVVRLASTAAASNVAQSASSTWPGYSNLMYCDPVVCSGPMQVVHIKVPVGQVKPNLGQTVGNAFVNAEVVVGPDGVARAIRVAN
jgi:hypothetical protein